MFIGTIPIRSCQSFKSLDASSTLVQPRTVVALITCAFWKCGRRSILLLWRIKGRINNLKIHFCWIQEKGSMKKPTDGVEMFKPLLFSTHHWKHSHEDIFTFFCFISNNICGGAAEWRENITAKNLTRASFLTVWVNHYGQLSKCKQHLCSGSNYTFFRCCCETLGHTDNWQDRCGRWWAATVGMKK